MKKTAMICILSMLLTLVAPFAVSAAEINANTGVLYWDFEDGRQVARPPIANNSNAETNWDADPADKALGGAWTSLDNTKSAGNSMSPIYQVAVASEVYTIGSGSGWDDPAKYYPSRKMGTALAKDGKVASFEMSEVEHLGTYCAAALSKNNSHVRVLGINIQLSELQLIPNQKYKFECDAYLSNPETGWSAKPLYAGFSTPSARKTKAVRDFTTPYALDTTAGNATWCGELSHEVWTHLGKTADGNDVIISAPDSAFENGETVLYVGIMSETSAASQTSYISGGTKLFIDNIKLTPVDDSGNVVTSLTHSAAKLGGSWNFEGADYSDVRPGEKQDDIPEELTTNEEKEQWILERTNVWTALDPLDSSRKLTYQGIADVEALAKSTGLDGSAYSQIGYSALGSTKCIGLPTFNGDKVKGIRVTLPREEYPNGTYTLKVTTMTPNKVSDASFNLYAAILPGATTVSLSANPASSAAAAAGEGNFCKLENIGPWWTTNTCTFEISDADFDSNGYATLVLLTSKMWKYNAADGGGLYSGDPQIYYDDISFTKDVDEFIENCGTNNNVLVKTAVYGPSTKDVLIAGRICDQMSEEQAILALEGASMEDVLGVRSASFKLDTGDTEIILPYLKTFVFDKNTLAPMMNKPFVFGMSFE